jgi:transposase
MAKKLVSDELWEVIELWLRNSYPTNCGK